jgi:hypothetical protein
MSQPEMAGKPTRFSRSSAEKPLCAYPLRHYHVELGAQNEPSVRVGGFSRRSQRVVASRRPIRAERRFWRQNGTVCLAGRPDAYSLIWSAQSTAQARDLAVTIMAADWAAHLRRSRP